MSRFTSARHNRLYLSLGFLGLALVILACVIPGIKTGPSGNTSDLLPEPSTGLADLKSYQAVYDRTLQGTIDGKPFERQSHLEYSYVTQSQDDEVLWQEQQSGSSQVFQHTLRLGKAVYSQSQDGQNCWGEYDDQPAEVVPRPVSLLLPVTRASRVGAETVNGVATNHFHFDQNGLSSGEEGTSGEVWIAQSGGYVVKYSLSLPAPAQPTGQGVEITETLIYELKQINSISQIDLPAGCIPVLVDIPAMSDAQSLYRGSGIMDYTSGDKVAQAIDFYNQALPPLGWTQVESTFPAAQTGLQTLEYTREDQSLNVFLDPNGDSLEVTVTVASTAQPPLETTEVPGSNPTPGSQPTADASQSGLPADVPLYPGATNLIKLPNMGVSFSTSDPADAVAKFYREQLESFKWDLQNEMTPAAGAIIQNWSMSNRILVVNVVSNNGTTTVMLILSTQP